MILYGMLYAVGVGLPILLAALVSSTFLRKHGRAERGVWIGALVLALALPAVALTRPPAEAPTAPVPVVETGLIGLPAVVAVPEVTVLTVPVARAAFGLDEILIGLWLLASLVLAIRWAVAARRLARMTRACPAATVGGVRVRLTHDLGPAVAGWVRPRILVPSWLMSLPEQQRSLVLLHEEEHVRARDPLLIAISRVARILVPWNPVVWLLSVRLLQAVELDCDRRVLRRRPDVEAYGTTLLTVSYRDPGARVGAAAFAETEAPLRRRILAMTTPQGTVSILGLFTALVLGILLLLGAFQVPIPTVREIGPEASSSNAAVGDGGDVIEEMRRVLEAALTAEAELLAAHEATTQRVAALEAQLKVLEVEAMRRAELSGTVTGTVRDAVNDEPIENVQVFLRGTGIGTLTNDSGRFLLLHVPAGEREVVAQRIGFREVAQNVSVAGAATVDVDIALQETAVELDRVLVSGEPARPSGLPGAGSASEEGNPLVYIDGVRVEPTPSRLDDLIRPEEIDRIEIIKRDAAVELYGEEARAGVVLIYRKQERQESAPSIRYDPSGQPIFTPFTVAPKVLNRDEVQRAMREAYPPELRAEGIGGTVEVWFFITEDGVVQDTRINESSGHEGLDDAALRVAGVFRFSPALNRDARVAVWVGFPITFLPAG